MESPQKLIKHEKRKSLIMLGYISLGLIFFGAGFFIAGYDIHDSVTRQAGMILAAMGVIGGSLYLWGRKHPVKSASKTNAYSHEQHRNRQHSVHHR